MGAEEGRRWLERAKAEGFREFSKLLTWLERAPLADVFKLEGLLYPGRTARRIGITGPPGAGKSTLVGALLTQLLKQNLKIGVMAVDPSSPFTRGAILGDRIRYQEHVLNPNVFIRSLGTRGSLGGLSGAAFVMARAFDACDFDVLLIETVGVGQTELDILHVADQVGVVLVPESGDSVQAMKAGLMEIADFFVVNKSDRPGADGLAREIKASLDDGGVAAVAKPVFKTTALRGEGVLELVEHLNQGRPLRRERPERLRAEAKALLRTEWEREVSARTAGVSQLGDLVDLFSRAST